MSPLTTGSHRRRARDGVLLTYVDPRGGGPPREAAVHIRCDPTLHPGVVVQVPSPSQLHWNNRFGSFYFSFPPQNL